MMLVQSDPCEIIPMSDELIFDFYLDEYLPLAFQLDKSYIICFSQTSHLSSRGLGHAWLIYLVVSFQHDQVFYAITNLMKP
jgi:hypothetical protein